MSGPSTCPDIRDMNLAERNSIRRGHEKPVCDVAVSSDATRLASASGDAKVRIWDTLPPSARARTQALGSIGRTP